LAQNGAELWRGSGFANPEGVAVDPNDGSCWVAETYRDNVVHLAADGTELWRGESFNRPSTVSVDASDSSCWVANGEGASVFHLAQDGTELGRIDSIYLSQSLSADSSDGSCWVADSGNNQMVHLAMLEPQTPSAAFSSGGTTSGAAPLSVSFVDLSTGHPTAWSWGFGDTSSSSDQSPAHQYTGPGFYTMSLTASNAGGSNTSTKQFYVMVTFPDVPLTHWAVGRILACVDAGIVQGYADGLYWPGNPVTRDQMAVYIARGLAGGDANVPAGPATATFSDVPTDQWAFKYIEYCAAPAQSVVQGYSDGTYKPGDPVNRDAMAVYIARAVAGGDAKVPPGPSSAKFPDVPTDQWAFKYVEYCADPARGIVQGYPDGLYWPGNPVTRDQMAVYIQRAFKLPM
jgi:PKD repeat protein